MVFRVTLGSERRVCFFLGGCVIYKPSGTYKN
jgi:hypothetical protein